MPGPALDRTAIREGVSVCVVIAIPLTLLSATVFDDVTGGGAALLSLATLLGFVLGAGQAAWRQSLGAPLTHGIAVSAGTFVAIQAAIVLAKVAFGSDIRWSKILVGLTFSVLAGIVGGLLGSWMTRNGMHSTRSR